MGSGQLRGWLAAPPEWVGSLMARPESFYEGHHMDHFSGPKTRPEAVISWVDWSHSTGQQLSVARDPAQAPVARPFATAGGVGTSLREAPPELPPVPTPLEPS